MDGTVRFNADGHHTKKAGMLRTGDDPRRNGCVVTKYSGKNEPFRGYILIISQTDDWEPKVTALCTAMAIFVNVRVR